MIDVETPALLLYRDVLERNLTHMADRARRLGVSLRPHIKTHKCLELGRRQLALGATGVTVSTLFEAEAFARGGFPDLTWAFPLDRTHLAHVQRLADGGVTLRVVLDDLDTARAVAGSGLHVWLKVDCGYHRAGVDPSSRYALEVALYVRAVVAAESPKATASDRALPLRFMEDLGISSAGLARNRWRIDDAGNAAPTEDDHSIQALARLSVEHDLPGQDRHMLFGNVTLYDGDQVGLSVLWHALGQLVRDHDRDAVDEELEGHVQSRYVGGGLAQS